SGDPGLICHTGLRAKGVGFLSGYERQAMLSLVAGQKTCLWFERRKWGMFCSVAWVRRRITVIDKTFRQYVRRQPILSSRKGWSMSSGRLLPQTPDGPIV